MAKINTLPDYKSFLELVEYNPSEVEKYFNSLKNALEEERVSLVNSKNEKIEKSYQKYEEELKKYEDITIEILTNYFNEFRDINERYIQEITQLENDYVATKNELLDRIAFEEENITSIRSKVLLRYHDLEKPYRDKIYGIIKRIDVEYEQHSDTIFEAKEKILENNEYYYTAESHIKSLEETISFMEELRSFSNDINDSQEVKATKSTRQIEIYLDYIQELKSKILNIEPLLEKYNLVSQEFGKSVQKIEDSVYNSEVKLSNLNKEIRERLDTLNNENDSISKYFDEKMNESLDKKDRKNIEKKKASLLEAIENDKVRLSLESSLEIDLLRREQNNLVTFRNALKDLNESLKTGYENEIKYFTGSLASTFDDFSSLLKDELDNIEEFERSTIEARKIVNYFKKRYETIDIERKIESLNNFRSYLIGNIERNRKIDSLAFELLTNEELLRMKLLVLEKDFLTQDDNLEIKKMEYNAEIEILDETQEPRLKIENTKSELFLINRDLEIDKRIKEYELNSDIYILDLRKKIDLLRVDYMSAYARLENIQKIVEINAQSDTRVMDVESEFKIDEMIESTLIDAINKKGTYESLVVKYDKDIENLDIETKTRIRYLNDVLEIERNKFEDKKKKLSEKSLELEKALYPVILDEKAKSGKKIKAIKNHLNSIKDKEVQENDKNKMNFEKAIQEVENVATSYKNSSSLAKSSTSFMNSLSNLYKELNGILGKYGTSLISLEDKRYNNVQSKLENIFNKPIKENGNKQSEKKFKEIVNTEIESAKTLALSSLEELSPLDEKDVSSLLNEYDTLMKDMVANEIINNTIRITPHLDHIDEIRENKKNEIEKLNKEISEYKKSYIDTVKTIEGEYNDKLAQLSEFRNSTLESSKVITSELQNRIVDKYDDIVRDKNEKQIQAVSLSKQNRLDAVNRIESLSKEIGVVNEKFEQEKNRHHEMTQEYKKGVEEKAKEIFKLVLESKEASAKLIEEAKNDKIKYKEEYFRSLSENTLKFKEEYLNKKEMIEKERDEKQVSNAIEFGKLFSEVKDTSLAGLNEVYKPIDEFNKEIEAIISSTISNVDSITNKITENAEKTLGLVDGFKVKEEKHE